MKAKRVKNEAGLVELWIPILNLSESDFNTFLGSVARALTATASYWATEDGKRVWLLWEESGFRERCLYGVVFSKKGFSSKEEKRLREWITKTWLERFGLFREIIYAIEYLVNDGKLNLLPPEEYQNGAKKQASGTKCERNSK